MSLSHDQIERLYAAIIEWRDEYRPSCPESFRQMDRVNEALPELAESVFDVVGYHDPEAE